MLKNNNLNTRVDFQRNRKICVFGKIIQVLKKTKQSLFVYYLSSKKQISKVDDYCNNQFGLSPYNSKSF